MEKKTVLVVDDEAGIRSFFTSFLDRSKYRVFTASSGEEGISLIKRRMPQLVFLDLQMKGIGGIEVLKKAKEINKNCEIIIITAHGSVQSAVDAMKEGAYDYLAKPFDIDDLTAVVARATKLQSLHEEVHQLRKELKEKSVYRNMVGQSKALQEVQNVIRKVSKSTATVLIQGESGTGKELIARALHHESTRSQGPFVTVNCAALPEGLLESELFGFHKGAFTGALENREGKILQANGGTLVLDEISELHVSLQAKLLRVLQEREVSPLGGGKPIPVRMRVVAITNLDLFKQVKAGKFREDLYYRLNVIPIHVSPLRERKEDIPMLIRYFLEKFCRENEKEIKIISPEAMNILTSYSWAGNIRELENAMEKAVVFCESDVILPEHLPANLHDLNSQNHRKQRIVIEVGTSLGDAEKQLLLSTLDEYQGDKTHAAKALKVSLRTLQSRLVHYGLQKHKIEKRLMSGALS